MFGTGVDLEAREQVVSERRLRQHPLHREAQDLARAARLHPRVGNLPATARVAGVVDVVLRPLLLAGRLDLLDVHDDDEGAVLLARRVGGLVLAHQVHRDLRRETAERELRGIVEEPATGEVSGQVGGSNVCGGHRGGSGGQEGIGREFFRQRFSWAEDPKRVQNPVSRTQIAWPERSEIRARPISTGTPCGRPATSQPGGGGPAPGPATTGGRGAPRSHGPRADQAPSSRTHVSPKSRTRFSSRRKICSAASNTRSTQTVDPRARKVQESRPESAPVHPTRAPSFDVSTNEPSRSSVAMLALSHVAVTESPAEVSASASRTVTSRSARPSRGDPIARSTPEPTSAKARAAPARRRRASPIKRQAGRNAREAGGRRTSGGESGGRLRARSPGKRSSICFEARSVFQPTKRTRPRPSSSEPGASAPAQRISGATAVSRAGKGSVIRMRSPGRSSPRRRDSPAEPIETTRTRTGPVTSISATRARFPAAD